MSTQTRDNPNRSQRDELEQLQEELRLARGRRGDLPRDNAELGSQVARLEQEVKWLRRTVEVAREEAERPAASLPDQLVLPFRAAPSRRTAYGRTRYALQLMAPLLASYFYLLGPLMDSGMGVPVLVGTFLLCLALLVFVFQGPEDDEEGPAWMFSEEGLAPSGTGASSGLVRYEEIREVKVLQGPLQKSFGFGSLRITWTPAAPTSIGKALSYPNRSVDIDMLDDPQRLATWLRERVSKTKEAPRGV